MKVSDSDLSAIKFGFDRIAYEGERADMPRDERGRTIDPRQVVLLLEELQERRKQCP